MRNIALQNERLAAGRVASGSKIILDTTGYSFENSPRNGSGYSAAEPTGAGECNRPGYDYAFRTVYAAGGHHGNGQIAQLRESAVPDHTFPPVIGTGYEATPALDKRGILALAR